MPIVCKPFIEELLRILVVFRQRVEQFDTGRELPDGVVPDLGAFRPGEELGDRHGQFQVLGLRRDADVPRAGVAELRPIGVVRDAGHPVVEITVRVEAVDRADRIVGADIERRPLVEEDVVDRLLRGDRAVAHVPSPVILERLDRLRRVQVSGEGDAVGAHPLIGRATLLTGRAAHDAVLVIALPGALAPAQTPDVGDTVAGVINRGLQPGVPGLLHRPALNGLRRLEPGGVSHVLVVEHERAALHERWRVEGAVE